jgi:hypothetical protein
MVKDASPEAGFFYLRVFRGTCYGSPALTIKVTFAGDKISAELSEGLITKTVSPERSEAESLLLRIAGIIEKEEVLSGLRSVDVRYHAEIEWRNLAFIKGEAAGWFKAFSDEWFVDSIEIFMLEVDTPESAERLQGILDKKPHRHALEIYAVAHEFRRKWLK